MVMLSALKFVRVTGLGLVGAVCAVTAWPPHAEHTGTSYVVNRATVLGRSSRLGLVEAGRSESLAPRPAALPSTAVLGSATATLHCRRACTVDTPRITMMPLSSHHCRVRAGLLHLYVVAGPVRVASAVRTRAGNRRLVI